MGDDLGSLDRHGDEWTLTFTRRLAHPQEKVWRAVTEPEHLAVWFPHEIVGDGREPQEWGAPWRALNRRYADRFGSDAATIGPPAGWEPAAAP